MSVDEPTIEFPGCDTPTAPLGVGTWAWGDESTWGMGGYDPALTESTIDAAWNASIEAGVTLGWERHVGNDGLVIGIDRFGASAPAKQLFERFGFTAYAIVPQILEKIQK